MSTEMEMAEREDRLLGDMLKIIRFTEGVSAKLHRVLDEGEIYQVVKEEFAKSDQYTASILLLTDDGASLKLAETSLAPSKVEVLEKASGLQAKEYKIKLSKSSIYRQVVREGKTVQANVGDIIREFLPQPQAYLISKTMGYDKQFSILTPLRKHGKVTGVLAMSCTDLCEFFLHSVENLALHISTALELAQEHAQRKRAVQALKGYHDRLGELVEERTAELEKVNRELREKINERKQAEEALQAEKNKLQSVINAMEYGLTIQDRDYNIIYQNEPLLKLWGDRMGEKCYRVYEGRKKICDGCPVEKAFKDGGSHTSERRVVMPSGEVNFWENTASPIRDARGRIVSCLEITRNITERKQAEEALADEVTRRRLLVDQSLDGIVVLDENAKVYEANQRFAEMLGYTPEEVLKLHTWDWDTQWTREQLLEMGRKVDETGYHLETYHRRKDGTIIDVEISVNGAMCAGQKLIFCVCRDVTARKRAEEALRRTSEDLQLVSLINDAANQGYSLQKIIKLLVQETKRMFSCYGATFYSISEDKKYLIMENLTLPRAVASRVEKLIGAKIPSVKIRLQEGSLYLKALQAGKPRIINDRQTIQSLMAECTENKLLKKLVPRIYKLLETDSVMQVPLVAEGEVIGLLDMSRKQPFTELELERFATIAQQLLLTIKRRRAEDKVRQQNEFLGNVLNSLTHPFYVLDANDYTIKLANPAAGVGNLLEKPTCYSLAHQSGKPCGGAEHVCPLEEVKKTKKAVVTEHIHYGEDGNARNIEVHGYPIFDAKGKVVQMIEYSLDVTERKRAEEALGESQEKFQKMFESVTDGISVIDLNGAIIETNPRTAEMHGFASKDELLGRNALELVAPRDHQRIAQNMRKAIKEGAIRGVEYTLVKADGSEFAGELSTNVVRDASGKPVAHITVARDITERKQAEETLQIEKNKLQSLINAMEDGLTIQDKDFNIIYQNELVETIFGDRVGEKCYRVYEGEEKLCEGCPVEKAFKDGKSHTSERRVVLPSGEVTFWENTANPIRDARGRIVSCLEINRNITERKQVEEELKLRAQILDGATDSIFLHDFDGNFIYVNEAACRTHGYSREEFMKMKLHQVIAPERVNRLASDFQEMVEKGEVIFESAHLRKDGSIMPAEVHGRTIESGGRKLLLTVIRDITERKQAEEALRESEDKYKTLFESTLDGLCVIDAQTMQIVLANETAAKIYGFDSPEEVVGRNIIDLIAPEERQRAVAVIAEEMFQKDLRKVDEWRTIAKDGREIWVSAVGTRIQFQGRLAGLISFQDITARRQAEQTLRESQKFSSSLLEGSPNPILVIDPDTSVRYVNPAFEKLTGFTLAEIAGDKAPHPWWPEERREEMAAGLERAMAGGGRRSERIFQKKNGERFWVEMSSAAVIREEKPDYFLINWLDITKRKQAEEALNLQRAYFQKLFDNSPDAIAWVDTADRFVNVNKGFETLFGYGAEEIKGRLINDTIVPEDRMEEASVLSQARFSNKAVRKETVRKRKDGSLVDVSIIGYPIRFGKETVGAYVIYTDITQHKRAEEKLQESEEYLKTIFDASTGGILVIEPETHKIVDANPTIIKMFGVDREEIIGHVCHKFVCPAEKGKCPITDLKQKVDTSERILLNAKGERVPILKSVVPITRHGRQYLLELIFDITERKQAEETLRESEEKFSKAFRSSPEAFFITMLKDNKIIEINESATLFTGYNREEMVGHVGDELNLWVYDEERTRMLQSIQKQGRVYKQEIHSRMKSGEIRVGLFSAEMINIGGEPGMIFSITDITERKRAEEALRESQKFSSSLLEGSPNPITVVELDTSTRYVNPAFEKLTGFTLAEIVGRKAPYPWWPEGKRARILAAFKDAIEHGGRRTERHFQKKNGERFWAEINSAPVMREGKPIYLIINWLDITERKRAEEKEKQLQQELYLAQRLASVGELAAGVAHEINNPLTGVLGFSQRLMRKSTDEAASRDLEIIHGEARRAAEVVQNLLTFARRRQPKKEYASVNDVVQKTLELRDYALQTSNIEVVTDFGLGLPQIMVDFPQMQEVFLNIVLNAEQAMSEAHGRGKLIIKTREIKDYVRVSFADDGPGISPKNLDKVFDPFFTTRAERGGTGLGLSACHGIVTEHGGKIYVRSKPGKGATFFVELPLSPAGSTLVS